jgi:hypothetical protein
LLEVLWRKTYWVWVMYIYWPEFSNLLYVETQNSKIWNIINSIKNRETRSIFTELWFDKTKDIRSQTPNPLPDRKELDDIIFDELGLTPEERNEVYRSLAELVKARLDKAKSV